MKITEFGHEVKAALTEYVAPGRVQFRGSFERDEQDEYSDVDIEAFVENPLNPDFYEGLVKFMEGRFGKASVRFDPAYEEQLSAQDVRFSFHDRPIFWRVDLLIRSVADTDRKYPHPFPEWSLGTSALMNLVWAVKSHLRHAPHQADHFLASACQKIGLAPLSFNKENLNAVLDRLLRRPDTDPVLLAKTSEIPLIRELHN